MTKVQLTLTDQEAALLMGYGSQFGYSLPKIAKFFISKATERIFREGSVPVFKMSDKTEMTGLKALDDYHAGKTIAVQNIEEHFNNL